MHDLLREHALGIAQTHAVDVEAARDRLLARYSAVLGEPDIDPGWLSAGLPSLLVCLRLPGGGPLLGYALTLGRTLEGLGRLREAEAHLNQALAGFRNLGDKRRAGRTLRGPSE